MKHNYDNLTALYGYMVIWLHGYMFVDSMQVLQSNGCAYPGLDALLKDLGVGYSAFDDASILMSATKTKISLLIHVVIHLKILHTS